jgi:hypothetical protein
MAMAMEDDKKVVLNGDQLFDNASLFDSALLFGEIAIRNADRVQQIVSSANDATLNARDWDGATPLARAILNQDMKTIAALLCAVHDDGSGIDLNATVCVRTSYYHSNYNTWFDSTPSIQLLAPEGDEGVSEVTLLAMLKGTNHHVGRVIPKADSAVLAKLKACLARRLEYPSLIGPMIASNLQFAANIPQLAAVVSDYVIKSRCIR